MNPVRNGNRAISVQTKGQPLAIVAVTTQAPKVMMPTEISSESTLSMIGCSSRLLSPGITENSAAGDWFREALRTTPAKALGIADRTWTIAQLVDAALAVA